MFGQAFSE